MSKIKQVLLHPRMILLLILLIGSLILIKPSFDSEGVAIRSVVKDSPAADAGFVSPKPTDKPRMREVITSINGEKIRDVAHFEQVIEETEVGDLLDVRTMSHFSYDASDRRSVSLFATQQEYIIEVQPITRIVTLNETEEVIVEKIQEVEEEVDGELVLVNKTVNVTEVVAKTKEEVIGKQEIGLSVYEAPTTNIRKGLDLEGGTRVLLKPEHQIEEEDMTLILDNLKQRLNVYGLSDIVVRSAGDFASDAQFIVVEIAGANEQEVKDLIGRQGVFEARIGNETAFSGGDDIKSVCRTPDCSFAVSPYHGCSNYGTEWQCTFQFSITLSQEAAQRQASITDSLNVIPGGSEGILDQNIDFYLDNELVDSLTIGAGLKGNPETNIAISGPGTGRTEVEARTDSAKAMRSLQTILVTGSLPVKLEIVKTDTISPLLGKEFITNALFIGMLAILSVAAVVFVRYRSFKISGAMLFTMVSELILILGLAAAIGWNLDLAAIAGILIAVGTGVDDQIVITDETMAGAKKERRLSWKERLKKAFFIIMAAYFTTVVAMFPLISAGAGLLRGFAITTIFGVTFGVFITRPVFAAIVEKLVDSDE